MRYSFAVFCFFLVFVSYGQNTILIEKTLYLTQEHKYDSTHVWCNEAVPISVSKPIKSISYWVGMGEESLKELETLEKQNNLKNNSFLEALHTKKISAQNNKKQTGELEIRILHNYTNGNVYNCEKKFLEGGFIIYRIHSKCYWHGRFANSGDYEQAILWEESGNQGDLSKTSASFIVRSKKKIDKPIFVKILVETE